MALRESDNLIVCAWQHNCQRWVKVPLNFGLESSYPRPGVIPQRPEFRLEIARRFGLVTKKIIPYTLAEKIVPRPRKCVLKCKLVEEVFEIKFDDWKIVLKRCLNEVNKDREGIKNE